VPLGEVSEDARRALEGQQVANDRPACSPTSSDVGGWGAKKREGEGSRFEF